MRYNSQTNLKWANDIMNSCKDWKIEEDFIWRWGCVVTCIANILQEHSNRTFTPDLLNNLLKDHKGYWYLNQDLMMKEYQKFMKNKKNKFITYKEFEESHASFIDWSMISNYFRFKVSYSKKYSPNDYNIARIELPMGGHYINVIKRIENIKMYLCFDVLNGELKFFREDEITGFRVIRFE